MAKKRSSAPPASKAAEKAAAADAAEAEAKARAEKLAAEKAQRDERRKNWRKADPDVSYVVAAGKNLCCLAGLKSGGDPISAADLSGADEDDRAAAFDHLVHRGYVVDPNAADAGD